MNRRYRVSTIQKLAEVKFENPLVWYTKQDGWWIETELEEIFIGSDSGGAYNFIKVKPDLKVNKKTNE